MAIVFQCKCGRPLRANLEAVGKRTRCPGCGQILIIPSAGGKPETTHIAPTPTSEIGDPFALELDWSTVESKIPAAPDTHQVESGAIKIDSTHAEGPLVDIARTEDGSRQYRVLSQKDQGFAGKFNAGKLEEILNAYARQGWVLKIAVTMNLPSHGGHHDEMIVILER